MIEIFNSYQDFNKKSDIQFDCDYLKEFLNKVLKNFSLKDSTVEISIVPRDEIRSLNLKFRNIDSPTDVLSFPQYKKEELESQKGIRDVFLGDIIISPEDVMENCIEFGEDFQKEIMRVALHGLLHLLSYDHSTTDFSKEEMLILQEQILNELL